ELFANRREAAVILAGWRREYNQERPHSSLGYRTPREFRAAWKGGSHGTDETGHPVPVDPAPTSGEPPEGSVGPTLGHGIYPLPETRSKLGPAEPSPSSDRVDSYRVAGLGPTSMTGAGWPSVPAAMKDVTGILSAIDQGDPHAAEQLLPLVYDELRRL